MKCLVLPFDIRDKFGHALFGQALSYGAFDDQAQTPPRVTPTRLPSLPTQPASPNPLAVPLPVAVAWAAVAVAAVEVAGAVG